MSRWSSEKRRKQRAEWDARDLCTSCGHGRELGFKTCSSCRGADNLRDAKLRIEREPKPMSCRAGSDAKAVIEAAREWRRYLLFDKEHKTGRAVADMLIRETHQRLIHAVGQYEKKLNRPINIKRRAIRILFNRTVMVGAYAQKGVTTEAKETSVPKCQSGDGAAPSRVASL